MASGSFSLGTSGALAGQIIWSSSSNGSAANSSNVSASLQIRRTDSYSTTGTFSYYFGVGDESVNTNWYGTINSNWTTIATLSDVVSHGSDGKATCYIGGKVNGPSGTTLAGKTVEAGQSVTLDTIPRAASLLSAPNFSDSDKPTITYSNPAGTAATVQAGIFDTNGGTSYVGYRNVSQTGSSYTFNFTEAEINNLRNAVPTGSDTMYVRFYLKTIIGSTSFFSYLTRILTVKRPATISSAPNFTDEDNPTITYSNPGGSTIDEIQVAIYQNDGETSIAGYRNIPIDGTSYTFELTDAERQKLINAIPDGSNNTQVRFYIKTYKDGSIIDAPKYTTRTLTVINATPEIECIVKDAGSASKALTNDQNVIIRGFNYVTASITPTLKKGATVSKQSVSNGGQTVESGSVVFNNTEDGNFIFSLTDSFGQTVIESITLTVIPYINVTCNLVANNPTADGTMAFKISGNFFNGTFGDKGVNNKLTVKWRIKENNNEYGEWIPVIPVVTGDTYSITVNATGLNYRSTYTVQAMAADLIKTNGVLSAEQKGKSIPVYNWGEDNFDINVPLTVDDINTKNVTSESVKVTDVNATSIIGNTMTINEIMCGNAVNISLELGSYNTNTGVEEVNTASYRNADPVEVESDTTYIITVDGIRQRQVVLFYDENNTFIGETRSVGGDGVFVTPTNTKYINFRCFQSDFTQDYTSLNVKITKASPIKYVNNMYPVGSIYISVGNTSPALLFGGTWEQIKGRFLLATGVPDANTDTYFGSMSGTQWNAGVESRGGQDFHTLTVSEMPSHNHSTSWRFSGGSGSNYSISWVNGAWQGPYENAIGAFTMSNTGGGARHNNMPPYLGVYMWKRIS